MYLGYILTNHFPLLEPHYLPLTALDNAIPFLVWTVVPYFILVLGMYFIAFVNNRENFLAAITALTIAVCINYTIYLIFPTTIDRPPVPTQTGITYDLYRWLISIDTPGNCLPSGHITSPAIGCWYLSRHKTKLRIPILVVFSLLAATTLTTKQHYLIDIPAGLVTATIGILIANKIVKKNGSYNSIMTKLWRTPVTA